MTKLSPTMQSALDLIKAKGGIVHALGGGFWGQGEGELAIFRIPTGCPYKDKHGGQAVSTHTIYALEKRGLLERIDSRPKHKATRRITWKGATLGDGLPEKL